MKKLYRFLFPVLTAVLILTACGGASADAKVVMETAAAYMAAPAAGAMKNEIAVEEAFYPDAPMEMDTIQSSAPMTEVIQTSRKLIRTVHLNVETYDFDELLIKLQEQISAMAGYIEQSDISGNSVQNNYSRRHAYLTVRVPSTSLDQFITSVEDNGNVTNKSETTTDITLQYSDLESRRKSLTIEQDRIWELLEKADNIESIIALEERLSEIRYELESMESKLRLYDNQVEYSTVYVNISEVKVYTPTEPDSIIERIQKGFARNLENLKTSAVNFIVWFVSSIPFLLPLAVILLMLLFTLKKKLAKRSLKKLASSPPSKLDANETSNK